MIKSDRNLLMQMIRANRFNYEIYQLLVEANKAKSAELVEKMGDNWCCSKANAVRRLEVPLEILKQNQSKVLKRK